MALKDLITDKGALDEAAIERIVGSYARYDVEAKEITFMPAFAALSNRAKILVYLVALLGWKFVTDDPIPSDARPADIEITTGIAGGSLRPTLRGLCESHVLSERDSRYAVRGTSLPGIEAELNARETDEGARQVRSSPRRKSRRGRATKGAAVEDAQETDIDDGEADPKIKRSRKVGAKTGNIAATFDRWINEGYFDDPRTLAEVQQRFRKEAMMVPQTSLPGYFLGAVRKGRLKRDEMEVGGRTVWGYSTNKVT
jgi:hypothetical protein